MSDKHLERKEVLNLVYTRQADRMADAYARLMADFSQMTAWGRGLESDLSWARAELMQVKAELERVRLIAHDNKQALYNAKAEVERLTAFTTRTIIPNEELQAQVERLTKAGDALYDAWIGYHGEQILDNYNHGTGEICRNWNAAKEGKQ